jgi:hypothetical protein
LDSSVERASFVRQLYNLHYVLEMEEETEDTAAKIQDLISKIEKHNKGRMKTFHTKDTPGSNHAQRNKRPRLNSDVDDRGAGGGAGGADATDCAELGAHGYEVEPRDIVDEDGIVYEPLFDVRRPLST